MQLRVVYVICFKSYTVDIFKLNNKYPTTALSSLNYPFIEQYAL